MAVFREQRSGRWPCGLEFLNFFVGGNTEVFSSSTILNDFTKSDFNLDFSVFFCMAFPKCLQSSTDMINLRFTASLWTLLLDSRLRVGFHCFVQMVRCPSIRYL